MDSQTAAPPNKKPREPRKPRPAELVVLEKVHRLLESLEPKLRLRVIACVAELMPKNVAGPQQSLPLAKPTEMGDGTSFV